MIEEFFSGFKSFSELEVKDRLSLLFDYLKYVSKHPKLTRGEIEYFYRKDRDISYPVAVDTLDYVSWGMDILHLEPKGFPAMWYFKVTNIGKRILERGYILKEDYIDAPEWVIRRLERPPIDILERAAQFISGETSDGYGELWYSVTRKLYYTKIDEKINILFKRLVIVVTASVATGGIGKRAKKIEEKDIKGKKKKGSFQRMTCEVTSWTIIKNMRLKYINAVENQLEDFLDETMDKKFGVRIKSVAIKTGVEYYTEESIGAETNEGVKIEDIPYPHMKVYIEYSHNDIRGVSSPIEVEK